MRQLDSVGNFRDIKKEMKLTSEQLATYSHVLEGYNEKREKNFKDAPGWKPAFAL